MVPDKRKNCISPEMQFFLLFHFNWLQHLGNAAKDMTVCYFDKALCKMIGKKSSRAHRHAIQRIHFNHSAEEERGFYCIIALP